MNVILIGYRGTGKSCVAQRLALRLGWLWVDADVEVELAAGKSIAEIFRQQGEAAFRQLEARLLKRLLSGQQQILALGGGVVMDPENCRQIREAGNVVWLRASAQTIDRRLAADPTTATQRPDLTADGGFQEIVRLLAQRERFYRQCATIEVDTDEKDIDQVTNEILARLNLLTPDR